MLKDILITKKIPFVMITFALMSALVTGTIAFNKTSEGMNTLAKDNLKSLLSSRKSALTQYFDTIIHQVTYHAKSPLVIQSLQDFSSAWQGLKPNPEEKLQHLYLYQNPYPQGKRNDFLTAHDHSDYSVVHQKSHPLLNNMIDTDSYYDLFLISPDGNLLYSVQKEADFASNLLDGQWKSSSLADLFRRINQAPQAGKIHISDFSPYLPSNNKPASFIGSSVFSEDNQYIGAVILQLPIEPINNIMQVRAGMGDTGETYLVGEDFLMRSNSRFFHDRSILTTRVKTSSVIRALQGETGFSIVEDYRQVMVYSSFTSFNVLSLKWAMLAEIDKAEVLRPVYNMSNFLLISAILITSLIFIFGYFLSRDIAKPIVAMTTMMRRLANNELNINISVSERRDEIGKMAEAMVVFKQNAIEREQLRKELSHIANIDALTGLYTRKYAMDQLRKLMDDSHATHTKLVLMFLDLDNFKQINDRLGHHIGDQTLCSIAEHLRRCVREKDIIARIGGDEFIIIFPDILDINDISPIANDLLESLPTQALPLSFSIGMSVFPDDANNALDLLKNADIAMYNVKKSGKNNVCYWQEKNSKIA